MPQFSVRDLLWATLLVAVGTCLLVPLFRVVPQDSLLRLTGLPGGIFLLVSGFGAIFAGLFTPFHRTKMGFKVGAALAVVLIAIVFAMVPRVH